MHGYDLKNRNTLCKLYVDYQCELNTDLKAIVEISRSNIDPKLYAKLLNCQAISCTVEQSFNMLRKLLAKFFPQIMFENI